MFLTSLKQTCNDYLIKFSDNQSTPKLENRKTSPCSPCAPNLLHVLVFWILGYHNLCSPVTRNVRLFVMYDEPKQATEKVGLSYWCDLIFIVTVCMAAAELDILFRTRWGLGH